jgi:hypothetical protein
MKRMFGFRKKKVLDFSNLRKEIKAVSDVQDFTQHPVQEESAGLGFLGAMASSADSGMQEVENIHFKDLKVKMEDVEYKLENFSKRISGLIDRVDLLEKKVDRDIRRGNA